MTAVELNAETTGPEDGVPLLLGGSLGTTLAMWDPQLAALAQAHRVIRLDHRGHGRSPVPQGPYALDDLGGDVLALMDRLGIERTAYCGVSLGGMVGQWLAINAPDRIDRLVLISTSAHLPPAEAWHERAAAVRQARTPAPVADAVVARWFTPPYAERRPQVVARYREMVSSVPAEGYAACCEAIAAMDLRDELPRISAASLVLAGAQDPATPPDHAETIVRGVAGARLEVLDPGAHLLSVERAEEVTRLILDHMETAA
jgi:3-oxoadipate enol-lactonase